MTGVHPHFAQQSAAERRRQLQKWLRHLDRESQATRSTFESGCDAPRRLRRSLEAAGPVFAAAGRYLSSRIDLLPESACEELAKIHDAGPATPLVAVSELFARQVGCTPDKAFAYFDCVPFESRLFWQSHRATLARSAVIVRVIHPELQYYSADADLLPYLVEPLVSYGARESAVSAALDDFRREFQQRLTFEDDVRSAESLSRDAHLSGLLASHCIYPHLCTPDIAVYDDHGPPLAESDTARSDVARAVCLSWLRQALMGSVFPIDPRPENIVITRQGKIAFIAGPFGALSERVKTHELAYLTAVAGGMVDEAAAHFVAAACEHCSAGTVEEVRKLFRQMVPFRDGLHDVPLPSPRDHRQFADQILIHWRMAAEISVDATAVSQFCRGVLTLTKTATTLAPRHDSLAEAFREVRLTTALGEFSGMFHPSDVSAFVEKHALAMLAMPEGLDRLLTIAASGTMPAHRGEGEFERPRQNSGSFLILSSLLLGFSGVLLFLQKIAGPTTKLSADTVLLAGFLLVGLVLLRMGSRFS